MDKKRVLKFLPAVIGGCWWRATSTVIGGADSELHYFLATGIARITKEIALMSFLYNLF